MDWISWLDNYLISCDGFDRIGGTGSIPDLGTGSTGHHYMTSTPNSKSPSFGAALSGQDHDLCGNDPPVNFTRSLPRSAKDFSTLMYRNAPKSSNLASIASLYHDDVDDVLDDDDSVDQRRKQMKILQGLAREMNWSLPVAATTYETYSPSRFNRYSTRLIRLLTQFHHLIPPWGFFLGGVKWWRQRRHVLSVVDEWHTAERAAQWRHQRHK